MKDHTGHASFAAGLYAEPLKAPLSVQRAVRRPRGREQLDLLSGSPPLVSAREQAHDTLGRRFEEWSGVAHGLLE